MSNTTMTPAEREAFLAGVHVGILALREGERGPLAVPIWYDYAPGGALTFVTGRASRKGRQLAVGVRVSLCAQTEAPPYKYVTVEGPVVHIEPADVERDVRPVARRYLGEKGGDRYVEATRAMYADAANVLVRVRIEHWLGLDYSKEYGSAV